MRDAADAGEPIDAPDASDGSEPHKDDGGESDASDGGESALERRAWPGCEPLSPTIHEATQLTLTTDFFKACGSAESLPDRAFTWTAPERGLYEITLRSDFIWEVEAEMELRRGACALTQAEGSNERPPEPPVCARHHTDENGTNPPLNIMDVEAGETLTIVVEGRAYHSETMEPQPLWLSVAPVTCPEVTLDEPLPSDTVFGVGESSEELKSLSCSTASYTRQVAVAWAAPSTGRYRFELDANGGVLPSLALGVLANDCLGEELVCDENPELASVTLDLEANEQVVLIIEVGDGGFESERLGLRVTAASQP